MNDNIPQYNPEQKRIIMVGNYGSGKTEISVNLALSVRQGGAAVSIADLDVVNSYFRCREASDTLSREGIRVVIPQGNLRFADLPIVIPEIKGLIEDEAPDAPFAIFDVGGDEIGARVLASFGAVIAGRPHALLQVINTCRPFTGTVEGCLAMKQRIEETADLAITGLVLNSHLMDETTPEVVLEGYDIALEVSRRSQVPIAFTAVTAALAGDPALNRIDTPILALHRRMVPPWGEDEARQHGEAAMSAQNKSREVSKQTAGSVRV